MTEAINIYLDKDSFYYFYTRKQNKRDKLISKNVSIEYAFEFCANKNFGEKRGFATQKTLIRSPQNKNHKWQKEHEAYIEKCGKKNTLISG